MHRVAITGSEGLIGRHLRAAFAQRGIDCVRIDTALAKDNRGHVDLAADKARASLQPLFDGCDGVIHLGAVSRVVWGERDPERCVRTNVFGTRAVLDAATSCRQRPWVLLASSREVYGNANPLPASEDAPLQPLNVYARSKVAAEVAVIEARARLRTGVVRLSSVYGDTFDHLDRVVPAFCRAAVAHGVLRVDGANNALDLTHALDVTGGLLRMMEILDGGEKALPIIHLVSGQRTTLAELAKLACIAAASRAQLREAAPRSYDVTRFVGDPRRAREVLGWAATTPLALGLTRLCEAYAALAATSSAEAAP